MASSLDLPSAGLVTLPNLQLLNLTDVSLEGNHLTSLEGLPLTLCTLNVANNDLQEEGLLYPFPSLHTLNAHGNRLCIRDPEEFTLCFPCLRTVNLGENRLRNLDFLQESQVEHVILNRNSLQTLSGLPSEVVTLKAEECKLTMIQSRMPPRLEALHLSYNSLRYAGLPLNWPSALRELHLDKNKIERFPRKLPDSLEVLTLNGNTLTTLPSVYPTSLHTLLVCNNRIQTVPTLQKRFRILMLDNNCLTDLPPASVARVFSAENNWNNEDHHEAQKTIRRCWKRMLLVIRLRHLLRTHRIREELFMVSMMPERWMQIDTLDPVWFRRAPCRNHMLHH
jgi:Leucine-rich repeat (LRR) protein